MRLEFELTESEFREAQQALSRRGSNWYRPLWTAGFIGTAAGFLLLIANTSSWIAPVLLLFLGVFVQGYPWLRAEKSMAKAWDTYSQVGPVEWDFSAVRVRFQTNLIRSEYSWRAFRRLTETRHLLLLDRSVLIPKRAFRDAQQLAEFRTLVESSLLPPAIGFPVQPIQK